MRVGFFGFFLRGMILESGGKQCFDDSTCTWMSVLKIRIDVKKLQMIAILGTCDRQANHSPLTVKWLHKLQYNKKHFSFFTNSISEINA